VCLDANGQAVFFTPKGKALAGAPPRQLKPGQRPGRLPAGGEAPVAGAPVGGAPVGGAPAVGTPVGEGFTPPEVDEWGGMQKYNFDSHIPWEEEARAWEAVDPA